jgi:sodium/potassium/calcium exchanger 4
VQLNWWPVARDSTYYCLSVLVLIFVTYDGHISSYESAFMLVLYVGYIVIMHFNELLHQCTLAVLEKYGVAVPDAPIRTGADHRNPAEADYQMPSVANQLPPSKDPYKMSLPQAVHHVILQHKRLFRAKLRFRSAAQLIMIRNKKSQSDATRANASHGLAAMRPPSMSAEEIEQYWRTPPNFRVQGFYVYMRWLLIAPLYAVLHQTVPDVRARPNLFMVSFLVSVTWIALFSYVMVWMVTIIGFTFGIPDSIMGITLLAAGTSVPDAYASLHVASLVSVALFPSRLLY